MKMKCSLLLAAIFSLFTSIIYAANPSSPIGLWKTIDDVTNKPKAIIQISETGAHTLQGKVLKIFPRPGYDQNELCTECKGARRNQRIVGMIVLEGLRPDKKNADRWIDGEILDPKNGKTYHCTAQLIDNNQKLNVRGYIGLPLFGRSQTWVRVEKVE